MEVIFVKLLIISYTRVKERLGRGEGERDRLRVGGYKGAGWKRVVIFLISFRRVRMAARFVLVFVFVFS